MHAAEAPPPTKPTFEFRNRVRPDPDGMPRPCTPSTRPHADSSTCPLLLSAPVVHTFRTYSHPSTSVHTLPHPFTPSGALGRVPRALACSTFRLLNPHAFSTRPHHLHLSTPIHILPHPSTPFTPSGAPRPCTPSTRLRLTAAPSRTVPTSCGSGGRLIVWLLVVGWLWLGRPSAGRHSWGAVELGWGLGCLDSLHWQCTGRRDFHVFVWVAGGFKLSHMRTCTGLGRTPTAPVPQRVRHGVGAGQCPAVAWVKALTPASGLKTLEPQNPSLLTLNPKPSTKNP